jgi:hypothetical protein
VPKASGHANIGGLGDIEVATGTAFRLSNTWRTGGDIELHADTASNPALGDNVWRLHFSWSAAHDVTGWLTLTPTGDTASPSLEEHNVAPQRYLELCAPPPGGIGPRSHRQSLRRLRRFLREFSFADDTVSKIN